MTTRSPAEQVPRSALSRERVLHAAVELADREGIDAVSMRRLAAGLGVVPMAIYKHVANKEELLDGMIDIVLATVDRPRTDLAWKAAVRERILSARRMLLQHPWASSVMESRATPTPTVLSYFDSMIEMFTRGGFSIDLTHHVMHAMGSRLMGFSQELFNDQSNGGPGMQPEMLAAMSSAYPSIYRLYLAVTHDDASVVGPGCDDQLEFEFALDLMLDGIERIQAGTRSHELDGR